jgi:hypothetical protein
VLAAAQLKQRQTIPSSAQPLFSTTILFSKQVKNLHLHEGQRRQCLLLLSSNSARSASPFSLAGRAW